MLLSIRPVRALSMSTIDGVQRGGSVSTDANAHPEPAHRLPSMGASVTRAYPDSAVIDAITGDGSARLHPRPGLRTTVTSKRIGRKHGR